MNSRQVLRDRANALARTALAPIPLAFWECAFPKDVIALCYHVVSDADLPHLQLYHYKDTARFEADVAFARERAVTYRQVVARRVHGAPLAPNGVLFTFDDGLTQCYDVIAPILKRYDVDGVFFVTTDYLDDRHAFFECALSLCLTAITALSAGEARAILNRLDSTALVARADRNRETRARHRAVAVRLQPDADEHRGALVHRALGLDEDDPELTVLCELLRIDVADYAARNPMFMSREAVRKLASDGFTVGAHGRRHRSLEGVTREELEREMVESCEAVRAITGRERIPFAFPYSGVGIDRGVLAGILERNPIIELVFDSGCLRSDPNFIVNRVFADEPKAAKPPGASNVPTTLRGAWSVPSAWFRHR